MEEESLLFKEKENCADGDGGDFEHATSHVSADCINNLLTNMGRFLSSRQGKLAKSGQQSTKGNSRRNMRRRQ